MDTAQPATMDQAATIISPIIDNLTGSSQKQQSINRKRAVPDGQQEAGGKKRHEENEQQIIEELCEWVIQQSLEDIEKNSQLLRWMRQHPKEKLREIIANIGKAIEQAKKPIEYLIPTYGQEYFIKIRECIQRELNLDINWTDDSVRYRELADVLFYLMQGHESTLTTEMKIIFINMFLPIYFSKIYNTKMPRRIDRYKVYGKALENEDIREHYFYRFGNDPAVLEYHINKLDQVEKQYYGAYLMGLLPLEKQRHFYRTIKYGPRLTFPLFYAYWHASSLCQYCRDHGLEHFLEKISFQDSQGQTVLYVKPMDTLEVLCRYYSPKYRNRTLDVVKLADATNKTSRAYATWQPKIVEFIECVKSNKYPIWGQPAVLIVSNTKDRKGAQTEARTICKAFRKCSYVPTIEFDQTKDELVGLIRTAAQTSQCTWLPPALIVIVASHGGKGAVEDCDGNEIKLEDIGKTMCEIESLKEHPKVLIVQCCQNDSKLPVNNNAYSPTHPNFCAITSSVPGQKSTRNNFLHELAGVMRENRQANKVRSIFKTIANVCKKMEEKGQEQTPIVCSTMSAECDLLDAYVPIW